MVDKQSDLENATKEEEVEDGRIILKTEICSECNVIFFKKNDLTAHMQDHITSQVCTICGNKFNKKAFLKHMKIHVSDKPHVCPTSDKKYARFQGITTQMNTHSEVKAVCSDYKKGSSEIPNVNTHVNYVCSICDKVFTDGLSKLSQHVIRSHKGIKDHICNISGNAVANNGPVKSHLLKHTDDRPYVCPICNHGYKTPSALTMHSQIHSKPYECDFCKKKFSYQGNLVSHKRKHTGEKPFVCQICVKAFSRSDHLKVHLRLHTGEKPCICDLCGKAFRHTCSLIVHKKSHEKPLPVANVCDVCGKAFEHKGALKQHRKSHDRHLGIAERTYSCHMCGQAFAENSALTTHLETHADKNPIVVLSRVMAYSCHVCGKAFEENSVLTTHLKTHVDKNPFVVLSRDMVPTQPYTNPIVVLSHVVVGTQPWFVK